MPSIPDKRRDAEDDDDDALVPVKKDKTKTSKTTDKPIRRASPAEASKDATKSVDNRPPKGGRGDPAPEIFKEAKEPAPPPKKEKTGKVARPDPASPIGRASPAEAAPAPAAEPKKRGPLPLIIATVVVVGAIGGAAALLLNSDDKPKDIAKTPNTQLPVLNPQTRLQPSGPQPAPTALGTVKEAPKTAPSLTPIKGPAASEAPKAKPIDLAKKSSDHAAIARILEEYDKVREIDMTADDRMFEDYRQREAKERELIERIRALGPGAIPAIKEMLLGVDDRAYQLLMAKALAGWDNADALKAAADVLSQLKDVAVQTTIVRFLPDTPAAADMVAQAFGKEDNPTLRAMLMREYARRVGDGEGDVGQRSSAQLDQGRDFFRTAAVNDPDPSVRAEAVAIIGRRGDPRDADIVAQIAKDEKNVYIRQRAIVALGETGGQSSLDALEDLARRDDSLEIRASAVLAIGRVGGDRAINTLDQIARSDQSEEIRTRAERLAAALRARAQADAEEKSHPKVDTNPGGQPVPVEPPSPAGPGPQMPPPGHGG